MLRAPRPALALFVSLAGSLPVLVVGLLFTVYNGYCEDSVSVEYDAEHCHFHDGEAAVVWLVTTVLLGAIAFGSLRLVAHRGPPSRLGLVRGLVVAVAVVGSVALGLAALALRSSG